MSLLDTARMLLDWKRLPPSTLPPISSSSTPPPSPPRNGGSEVRHIQQHMRLFILTSSILIRSSVFARLVVNGKDYGVKPFVVPLRDPATYTLKPGVSIGDCGMKMVCAANAFHSFTVSMFRAGMASTTAGFNSHTCAFPARLCWWSTRKCRAMFVAAAVQHSHPVKGTVTEPALNQLAYGALIQGRVAMVADSGNVAKKALTIACRYAIVRRQFHSVVSGPNVETQLIDYTIHQHRLMPLLAQTFAMHFTGGWLPLCSSTVCSFRTWNVKIVRWFDEEVGEAAAIRSQRFWGDWRFEGNPLHQCRIEGYVHVAVFECDWPVSSVVGWSRLLQLHRPLLHVRGLRRPMLLGGFVVFILNFIHFHFLIVFSPTESIEKFVETKNSISVCQSSNPLISCRFSRPQSIHCFKGDNTILILQSGRYLVNCYRETLKGKVQPSGVAYLNDLRRLLPLKSQAKTPEDLLQLHAISEAFNSVSANIVKKVGEDFIALVGGGADQEVAYERTGNWFSNLPILVWCTL